jgi:antitoxin component YwqK of YwqJK toxin-antitoxin module
MGNKITIGGIIVATGIFLGLYADGGVVCSDINKYVIHGAPIENTRGGDEDSVDRRSNRDRSRRAIERSRTIEDKVDEQTETQQRDQEVIEKPNLLETTNWNYLLESNCSIPISRPREFNVRRDEDLNSPYVYPNSLADRVNRYRRTRHNNHRLQESSEPKIVEIRHSEGRKIAGDKCERYSHLRDIILISRFNNGTESSRAHCVNGKAEGEEVLLFENGNTARRSNYRYDGQLHGKQQEGHENGQVATERIFVDGVLDGKQEGWHENGEKAWEQNYAMGQPEDRQIKWYDNKQILCQRNYIDSLTEGITIRWYESGVKMLEGNYSRGEKNGSQTAWYEDKQVAWTANFQTDHSHETKRGQNGLKLFEIDYDHRKLSHRCEWNSNGILIVEIDYDKDGDEWRSCNWNDRGRLIGGRHCYDDLLNMSRNDDTHEIVSRQVYGSLAIPRVCELNTKHCTDLRSFPYTHRCTDQSKN